jgi:hypothetical protein
LHPFPDSPETRDEENDARPGKEFIAEPSGLVCVDDEVADDYEAGDGRGDQSPEYFGSPGIVHQEVIGYALLRHEIL